MALKRPLRRLPISLPMFYVGLGWAVFALPLGLPALDIVGDEAHAVAAEYLTEFIVIVSLMAAGLANDRPFSWRGWRQVWPLLSVTADPIMRWLERRRANVVPGRPSDVRSGV